MLDQSSNIDRANALFEQGNESAGEGKIRLAEQRYLEALELAESIPESSYLQAACLHELASIHFSRREFSRAYEEYRKLHKIAEQILGADHPHVMDVLFQIESLLERISEGDDSVAPRTLDRMRGAVDGLIESNDWIAVTRSLRQTQSAPAPDTRSMDVGMTVAIVAMLLFAILGCYQANSLLTDHSPIIYQAAHSPSGDDFVSADGTARLRLEAHGVAELSSLHGWHSLPCLLVRSVRELPRLMTTGFIHRDFVFRDEAGALIGDNGSVFYEVGEADDTTLARMRAVAKLVEAYFVEHGDYPQSASDLGQDVELPIQSIVLDSSDSFRTQMQRIERGASWTDESQLQPGGLHALSLTLDGPDKQRLFLIRGGASDGKPLLDQTGLTFSLVLWNGSEASANSSSSTWIDNFNRSLVVFRGRTNVLQMLLIRQRWVVLTALLSILIALLLAYAFKKMETHQILHFLLWGAMCVSLSLSIFLVILQLRS